MHIEHLAIWVRDLETMKRFYEHYFQASANHKYHNPAKQFESYFLSFEGGPRLELMHNPGITQVLENATLQHVGLIHFAVSVGSEAKVNAMTAQFINDGYQVIDGPRWTGDGYYETVVLDPENNRIEITV